MLKIKIPATSSIRVFAEKRSCVFGAQKSFAFPVLKSKISPNALFWPFENPIDSGRGVYLRK